MNLYGFAGGDPINYSDPFGLCPVPPTNCADVVMAAVSVGKFIAAPSLATGIDAVLDVAGALPGVPSVGVIRRVVKAASNASELRRPYIRNGTREVVEKRASRTADGRFRDANTGEAIDGKYGLGHKRGHEFRREKARAEAEGLTQKEFNDRMNDPDKYQIEHPRNNRGHRYEQKP